MKFSGSEPLYLQIAEDLRNQILRGTLLEGDQIMSTTAYATTYRINPATAAKAFGILTSEGLIEKRRGLGMFVTTGATDSLRQERRTAYFNQILAPALAQGQLLEIPPSQLKELVDKFLKENS